MEKGIKAKKRLGDQPKPVIQRWWRFKGRKLAQKFARAYMRWKLPRTERKRRAALEAAFETIKYWAIKYEDGKFPASSTLYNIGLYLLIADRDIQAVKIDALTHPDEWTRKLSARIILLTIYEWDADKVTGRKLKDALDLMLIPEELKREAIVLLRELRIVQRNAGKKFLTIRNAAIAHRDPNALVQYRAIRNLNVNEVLEMGTEFFAAAEKLIGLLTKLMLAGNSLPSYLNQWSTAMNKQTQKQYGNAADGE
jgi:hypothetical protein